MSNYNPSGLIGTLNKTEMLKMIRTAGIVCFQYKIGVPRLGVFLKINVLFLLSREPGASW